MSEWFETYLAGNSRIHVLTHIDSSLLLLSGMHTLFFHMKTTSFVWDRGTLETCQLLTGAHTPLSASTR